MYWWAHKPSQTPYVLWWKTNTTSHSLFIHPLSFFSTLVSLFMDTFVNLSLSICHFFFPPSWPHIAFCLKALTHNDEKAFFLPMLLNSFKWLPAVCKVKPDITDSALLLNIKLKRLRLENTLVHSYTNACYCFRYTWFTTQKKSYLRPQKVNCIV